VSYHHSDPDTATTVTRELGELIARRESLTRREQASRAAERAKIEVDAARHALVSRRSDVADRRDQLGRDDSADPGPLVRYIGLLGSLPALELREDELERREAALSLGAALERRGIGMSFEVVDDAELSVAARNRSQKRWIASASFVLGIPLMAMAVGAFAPRKERA